MSTGSTGGVPQIPTVSLPHDPEAMTKFKTGAGFLVSLKGLLLLLLSVSTATLVLVVLIRAGICIAGLLACAAFLLILVAPGLLKTLRE